MARSNTKLALCAVLCLSTLAGAHGAGQLLNHCLSGKTAPCPEGSSINAKTCYNDTAVPEFATIDTEVHVVRCYSPSSMHGVSVTGKFGQSLDDGSTVSFPATGCSATHANAVLLCEHLIVESDLPDDATYPVSDWRFAQTSMEAGMYCGTGCEGDGQDTWVMFATISPTVSPTVSPTHSPTASPTTVSPTASPTVSPTTVSPTASPTASPTTVSPTASPTVSPTVSPTASPTVSPTASPTGSPTASPTESPTTRSPTLPINPLPSGNDVRFIISFTGETIANLGSEADIKASIKASVMKALTAASAKVRMKQVLVHSVTKSTTATIVDASVFSLGEIQDATYFNRFYDTLTNVNTSATSLPDLSGYTVTAEKTKGHHMVVGLRLWELAAANVSSAAFQEALLDAVFTEMSEVAEVPRDQVLFHSMAAAPQGTSNVTAYVVWMKSLTFARNKQVALGEDAQSVLPKTEATYGRITATTMLVGEPAFVATTTPVFNAAAKADGVASALFSMLAVGVLAHLNRW